MRLAISVRANYRVALLLALQSALVPLSALADDDWDAPDGHFFTQTGGGAGRGFLV